MRVNQNRSLSQLRIVALGVVAITLVAGAALAEDEGAVGPDVVTFDVYDPYLWGTEGGVVAYSVGTESCNRGDEPLAWFSSNNEHPVIAQNLYRYKDGRLVQIGMSWLKHGFLSLNEDVCDTCQHPPAGGSQLGVGCSDPYWASLNGSQDRLGPRHEVNPYTGENVYPHSSPTGSALLRGRLLAAESDMEPASNPSARYFAEGQYVAADEAAAGNAENSASYREQLVDPSTLELFDVGSTFEGAPAIYAWQQVDPTVAVKQARVPSEGLFLVASSASDNGNGTWRYEYGIFNVNSHRSAQSFTVPIEPGTQVTNAGFHDVDYHSGEPYDGTDWPPVIDTPGGTVSWSTQDYATNADANALRWGTMYNFWFDADHPPAQDSAVIGLFRDGSPASIPASVTAPTVGSLIFSDGFESGSTNNWS